MKTYKIQTRPAQDIFIGDHKSFKIPNRQPSPKQAVQKSITQTDQDSKIIKDESLILQLQEQIRQKDYEISNLQRSIEEYKIQNEHLRRLNDVQSCSIKYFKSKCQTNSKDFDEPEQVDINQITKMLDEIQSLGEIVKKTQQREQFNENELREILSDLQACALFLNEKRKESKFQENHSVQVDFQQMKQSIISQMKQSVVEQMKNSVVQNQQNNRSVQVSQVPQLTSKSVQVEPRSQPRTQYYGYQQYYQQPIRSYYPYSYYPIYR